MTHEGIAPATPPSLHGSSALVTFLLADVRGYTPFTLEHGDEAAAQLTARFATVAQRVINDHEGTLIGMRGDEVLCAFPSARNALRCAVALQSALEASMEQDPTLPLHVGVGLDAGEAIPIGGDYRGGALNLAARLCSLAAAGEVLASDAVVHLAGRIEGVSYRERGQVQLKGFADPVTVVDIVTEGSEQPDLASAAGSSETPSGSQELPIGGFLGALPTNTMVARTEELHRLEGIVDVVAGGAGRLVLLSGEPGAGKTRLAQELTIRLRDRGFLIASGRCYDTEQTVPYYPFLDVLATIYRLLPADLRAEVPARWPSLGILLPEVLGVPAGAGGGPDEEQRLVRTVTAFFEAMAETAPIALLLDDLHWADASSLKLLTHLARHTRASPILLLGTYRDVEVGRQHPLEGALRDLEREGLMERVAVRRLEEGGTAQLIAATIGEEEVTPEFAGLLYRRTEGNPFFVQQVLRVLVERGDLVRKDGAWERGEIGAIEVPESIRSVLGQRLSRLSDETQELLREASILGQTVRFDDLLGMTGRSEEVLEAGLEEAGATGILYETGRDDYAFDHALTQQALYEELSARRRRRLHLAAGEAIERLPERVRRQRAAELARHFLEGDDPEKALSYAFKAGTAAEAAAGYSEAGAQYRAAAELARELEHPFRGVEALEKLGHVLVVLGRYDDAAGVLEQVSTFYRNQSRLEDEARVIAEMAKLDYWRGRVDLSIDRVREVRAAIEGRGMTGTLGALYLAEAEYLLSQGLFTDFVVAARRALDIAREVDDDTLLIRALMVAAMAEAHVGDVQEAVELLEAAIDRAAATGSLYWHWIAQTILGEVYYGDGQLPSAREAFEQEVDLAERLQSPWPLYAFHCLGSTLYSQGDWEGASQVLERGLAYPRGGASWGSVFLCLDLGKLAAGRGRWDEGSRYLRQAWAAAEDSHMRAWHREVLTALAELERLRGDLAAARSWLERSPGNTATTPARAWVLLDGGQVAEAGAIARTGLETVGSRRIGLPDWYLVLGAVATVQQQWHEARAYFEAGVAMTQEIGMPYEEAKLQYYRGHLEVAQANRDDGQRYLEAAQTIFGRLGANPYLNKTEQALAEMAGKEQVEPSS